MTGAASRYMPVPEAKTAVISFCRCSLANVAQAANDVMTPDNCEKYKGRL